MKTPIRMDHLTRIVTQWGGLEDDQLSQGDMAETLAQRRYLVVEHGRDGARRWFNTFAHVEEALNYAGTRAVEDEWGFTAAYDLDTGQELKLEFSARIAERCGNACLTDSSAQQDDRVTVTVPARAWEILWQTLELDARSGAFDVALRRDITQAMSKVVAISGVHELMDAARDVLEWAERTGGWEAPCWPRLRQALDEARLEPLIPRPPAMPAPMSCDRHGHSACSRTREREAGL